MLNFGLRQAKIQIMGFINGLPYDPEVKRLLVKDIYEDVKAEADKVVLKEASEMEKALKEKEKEDGKSDEKTA